MSRKSIASMSEILRKGNLLLGGFTRVVQERIRKETGCKRDSFLRADFLDEMLKSKSDFPRMVCGVEVSHDAYTQVMACKDIEVQMYLAFERMITGLAQKCVRRFHTDLEWEDLESEGKVAFFRAMYYYEREDIQFSTYIHSCIHREMIKAVNTNHPMSLVSDHALQVYLRFEEQKRKMNGHATFEEVLDALAAAGEPLDANEVTLLWKMQVRVTNGSAHDEADGLTASDYTTAEAERRWTESQNAPDFDELDAIVAAELTDVESEVLKAWLNDGTPGWQVRVAEEIGYCKMSVTKIKDRIAAKVRAAYEPKTTVVHVEEEAPEPIEEKPLVGVSLWTSISRSRW